MAEIGGSNPSPASDIDSRRKEDTVTAPAQPDYDTLSTAVLATLPAMFTAVVAVFTAVLVPKFALRIGKYAIGRLSGIAGGR